MLVACGASVGSLVGSIVCSGSSSTSDISCDLRAPCVFAQKCAIGSGSKQPKPSRQLTAIRRFWSKRTISYAKECSELLISADYRWLFDSLLLIIRKCHVKNRLNLLLITGNVHCNRLLTSFIKSKCWKSVVSRRKMSLLP